MTEQKPDTFADFVSDETRWGPFMSTGVLIFFVVVTIMRLVNGPNPPQEPVSTYNRVVVTVTDPSAVCNDGSVSHSTTRSGTCSYHEGVENWND